MVTQLQGGDFETRSWSWQLLVDIVLRMAGGVLEFDTVQKTQVLSDAGNVSETTSTMATQLHFGCLNQSHSIFIFKCIL